MIKELSKGSTLIAKGPSRVNLLEGKIEVFGKQIAYKDIATTSSENEDKNAIIVPGASTFPFFALEKSKLEVYTKKAEETLNLVEENSIPEQWIEIKDWILDKIKKGKGKTTTKIMMLGISSGKTTLIKYLVNNFKRESLEGGYLDSDLGQQIMYLPTTINIGSIQDYIISSEDLKSEETVFIGATFPKANYKFIVALSCKDLIDNYVARHQKTDFIAIDTDGWIKTEAGIVYKNFFINTIDPDVLIVFHDESIMELKDIETNAGLNPNRKIFLIEQKNNHYYEKDKEERRFLRQSQFARILETYRKITIPLNDIKFVKNDYDKDTNKIIEQEIKVNDLIKLPYHYVIIALLTQDSKLKKIGLLFSINIEKNYILLFSSMDYKEQVQIKKILLGSLRLSTKGNHQGYLYL